MPHLIDPCITQNLGRRRVFWTTQPQACGDFVLCGVLCSIPGLEYEDKPPLPAPPGPPELVINGGFDDASGWTLNGGASIAGGILSCDGSGFGRAVRPAAEGLTPGDYHYAVDVLTNAGGTQVEITIGGSSTGFSGTGHFEGTITIASVANQSVVVGGEEVVCSFDNFSVKRAVAVLPPEPPQRTIKNNDWLRGMILNILNTRARTDLKCPTPAAVFGHWSESYRDDNMYIGTTLWNAAEKKYIRMADAVKAIGAAIKADVSKLVALGVADTVDVEATYRNSTRVDVVVTVTHTTQRHVIDLSGAYTSDTWVWH